MLLLRVARTFGTKTAQICDRKTRGFARKILKISAIAAAHARMRRKKDTEDHPTCAAQDVQVFLTSAMLFVAKFCIHKPRFSVGVAIFSTSFGAVFARDTRPSPAKTSSKAQECMARRRKPLE